MGTASRLEGSTLESRFLREPIYLHCLADSGGSIRMSALECTDANKDADTNKPSLIPQESNTEVA